MDRNTSSNALKVIGIILILAGLITALVGIHKVNEAKEMLSALDDGARLFGYSDGYHSGVNAWEEHSEAGKKTETVGFVISGIGLVFFLVGITQSNADVRAENAAKKKEASKSGEKSIKERIKELNNLHENGLLTDDEYTKKKQDIIKEL